MIASIVARTCLLVPFDAVDLVCERFDLGLPFIRASICAQNLRAQGCFFRTPLLKLHRSGFRGGRTLDAAVSALGHKRVLMLRDDHFRKSRML
jgi:hypothetical protein